MGGERVMPTYWVRNSAGNVSEDGSISAPFKTLAALHTALGGDLTNSTVRIYALDTFDEDVNASDRTWTGNSWTMEPWLPTGITSARPTITRAKRDLTWTFDGALNVWVSSALANITYGGCITEDNVALNWTSWNTNRATTVSAMPSNGAASFDLLTNQYLVRPRNGTPADHTYVASAGVYMLRVTTAGLFTVRGLRFESSSAGVMWGFPGAQSLTGGWLMEDVELANIGAYASSPSANYSGNGLGIIGDTGASGRSTIRRVVIRDVWDSGYSPQVFSANGLVQYIDAYEMEMHRCGLAGAEFSCTAGAGITSSVLNDCTLKRSVVKDSGKGWSGRRFANGDGIILFTNNSAAGCYVKDIDIDQNTVSGCVNAGIFFYQTNSTGNIGRRNQISTCAVGIGLTSRAGFDPANDTAMVENVVRNCTTGATAGRASSGLSGSVVRLTNNVLVNCNTGFSDITNTGDTAYLENNLICNSGVVAIAKSGSGTLTKNTNALYGNAANYGGTATQGNDIVLTSDPNIDNDGNSSLAAGLQTTGTVTNLSGDKQKTPDPMYIGLRPVRVTNAGLRQYSRQ